MHSLEIFFAKFDEFADSSNAVAKLRAMVLQLAMKGTLVPHHPTDGHVDVLLREIAEARPAKGRSKEASTASEDQVPKADHWYEIPSSWRWVRLGAIGDIVGGGTPRSDNAAYFSNEGIPWLTPADLSAYKEKMIRRGRRFLTPL